MKMIKYLCLLTACLCLLTACGEEGQKPVKPEEMAHDMSSLGTEEQSGADDDGVPSENGATVETGSPEEGTITGGEAVPEGTAIPEGQILEQSFEVELDGWGKVIFAAFEPEEFSGNSIWAYGDARFMLLKNDRVIYTFPGCYNDIETGAENVLAGQQFGQVLSVAFRDYNEDGRTDILLILEYAGVQGNEIDRPWQEVRAYTQEEGEKEFHLDKLLMEQLRYYSENMEQVYAGIEDYSHGYAVCTDISTWEVERFAKRVRKQILAGDFESIADEIAYPITVDGIPYEDKTAFLRADFVQNPSTSFTDVIRNETGELMFCNWQGIMMGNGEVWFSEVLNNDGSSQGLKIIGINGITKEKQ